MSRLSAPLELESKLPKPETRGDWVPLLDVLLIGLCLLAMGSSFVAAPGAALALPKLAQRDAVPVSAVLTLKHDNMLLYDGRIFTLAEMEHFFRSRTVTGGAGVLLVKVSRDVSMQAFLSVCDAARTHGYERLQIATESPEKPNTLGVPATP